MHRTVARFILFMLWWSSGWVLENFSGWVSGQKNVLNSYF